MSYQPSTRVILHPWYLLLLELHLLFFSHGKQQKLVHFCPFKALAHLCTIFMARIKNFEEINRFLQSFSIKTAVILMVNAGTSFPSTLMNFVT